MSTIKFQNITITIFNMQCLNRKLNLLYQDLKVIDLIKFNTLEFHANKVPHILLIQAIQILEHKTPHSKVNFRSLSNLNRMHFQSL
jgi:hypothetical protein